MDNYGLIRVGSVVPKVKVADIDFNVNEICANIDIAVEKQLSIVVFPELCITAYTCADLFGDKLLIDRAEDAVYKIKEYTRGKDIVVVVGCPVRWRNKLYNCAVVIKNDIIRGIVPKIYLPNYNEFYEERWFASGADFLSENNYFRNDLRDDGKNFYCSDFKEVITFAGSKVNINPNILFKVGHATFAIEICEDLWSPIPPSSHHALAGAEIILNLSASNEVIMKHSYRKGLISSQSSRTLSAYVYSSAGFGESSQDLVYSGVALIYENGELIAENQRFTLEGEMIVSDIDVQKLQTLRQKLSSFYSVDLMGRNETSYVSSYALLPLGESARTDFKENLYRNINPYPFIPKSDDGMVEYEILSIQTNALITRLQHIGLHNVVIGVSGGLDSTLALLVAVLAFDKAGWDRKGIWALTMPGFGTSGRTYNNALKLMRSLGVSMEEISIVPAVTLHFKDIGHNINEHDLTYENSQARERTQILMDFASKKQAIVLGTGDLSELALGWATYNGDQMSMYCLNGGVPKSLIKHLVAWASNKYFRETQNAVSDVLEDIIDTPVSPELIPTENGEISQITEDVLGPYELHDFFLYNYFKFGYSPRKIFFLALKAFGVFSDKTKYSREEIKAVLKKFYWRFYSQQFKRSCMPDCPKVGSVTLSPRGDWRMPSDAKVKIWIDELEQL